MEQAVQDGDKKASQDAYLAVTKGFFTSRLLPVSAWGYEDATVPMDMDVNIPGRWAVLRFLANISSIIDQQRLDNCLDWGMTYLSRFKCGAGWALEYQPGPKVHVDRAAHTIKADLDRMRDPGELAELFDLVLATQVFEHLHHPEHAAASLYAMTKPGGLAVVTVPFLQRFHMVPRDLFRYTQYGISYLFTNVGFEVEAGFVFGDLPTTMGAMLGYSGARFAPGDFEGAFLTLEEFNALRPGVSDPFGINDFYTHSLMLFRKPARA